MIQKFNKTCYAFKIAWIILIIKLTHTYKLYILFIHFSFACCMILTINLPVLINYLNTPCAIMLWLVTNSKLHNPKIAFMLVLSTLILPILLSQCKMVQMYIYNITAYTIIYIYTHVHSCGITLTTVTSSSKFLLLNVLTVNRRNSQKLKEWSHPYRCVYIPLALPVASHVFSSLSFDLRANRSGKTQGALNYSVTWEN